ncbi:ATP-binding cassette domain-containing protein [Streptomyces tsukubensis]|uniref:ABC transporter n=1 Tax=Streptomyces tsukubensis TaxID=83656 RepID=A0A1V4A4K1_9ACTN|nr:ATP-binding cassette domain-containing protein [Streptomyces tsukubensis]OON75139.1 ABC transporter [Streptomyces tsukubensis]QFR96113.1 ATP-binding cassette domain-containing protein [Streptomyces tsukubensis]
MIQAIGLTSSARQGPTPTVDDVSFEARNGRVTALLGGPESGRATALKLMLELERGRGATYFRGRPLHRIPHPVREVGVLLGEVPGHPSRTVRGHLRMLCAAAGVPATRADEVLEAVGLVSLREQRLGTLSRGMDRRLGLACALVGDPHTLVLLDPADGLSPRESDWLHRTLRAHASLGGTVLLTTGDAKEAARTADRVVTLERGRLVADQEASEFARTRLRPRVAVTTPYAARFGALLAKEARVDRRSIEIVAEEGNRLCVYGGNRSEIGEAAFRHGILLHQLADETGDTGTALTARSGPLPLGEPNRDPATWGRNPPGRAGTPVSRGAGQRRGTGGVSPTARTTAPPTPDGAPPVGRLHRIAAALRVPGRGVGGAPNLGTGGMPDLGAGGVRESATPRGSASGGRFGRVLRRHVPPVAAEPGSPLPPRIAVHSAAGPLRPLRYEIRRTLGIGTGLLTAAVVFVVSAVVAVLLARAGHTPQARLLAAWPRDLPLPPAAVGAGLLGALAFGDEFRHPALAADRGTVPRRLGLLTAKLAVSAVVALLLAGVTVLLDAAVLGLVYGGELTRVPAEFVSQSASWAGLVIGCAWAGLLAAGVFRSTAAGLAAVVAVPVLVMPLVQKAVDGSSVRSAAGFPARLRDLTLVAWPSGMDRWLVAGARLLAQPEGGALVLSLGSLLCAYLLTVVRSRAR